MVLGLCSRDTITPTPPPTTGTRTSRTTTASLCFAPPETTCFLSKQHSRDSPILHKAPTQQRLRDIWSGNAIAGSSGSGGSSFDDDFEDDDDDDDEDHAAALTNMLIVFENSPSPPPPPPRATNPTTPDLSQLATNTTFPLSTDGEDGRHFPRNDNNTNTNVLTTTTTFAPLLEEQQPHQPEPHALDFADTLELQQYIQNLYVPYCKLEIPKTMMTTTCPRDSDSAPPGHQGKETIESPLYRKIFLSQLRHPQHNGGEPSLYMLHQVVALTLWEQMISSPRQQEPQNRRAPTSASLSTSTRSLSSRQQRQKQKQQEKPPLPPIPQTAARLSHFRLQHLDRQGDWQDLALDHDLITTLRNPPPGGFRIRVVFLDDSGINSTTNNNYHQSQPGIIRHPIHLSNRNQPQHAGDRIISDSRDDCSDHRSGWSSLSTNSTGTSSRHQRQNHVQQREPLEQRPSPQDRETNATTTTTLRAGAPATMTALLSRIQSRTPPPPTTTTLIDANHNGVVGTTFSINNSLDEPDALLRQLSMTTATTTASIATATTAATPLTIVGIPLDDDDETAMAAAAGDDILPEVAAKEVTTSGRVPPICTSPTPTPSSSRRRRVERTAQIELYHQPNAFVRFGFDRLSDEKGNMSYGKLLEVAAQALPIMNNQRDLNQITFFHATSTGLKKVANDFDLFRVLASSATKTMTTTGSDTTKTDLHLIRVIDSSVHICKQDGSRLEIPYASFMDQDGKYCFDKLLHCARLTVGPTTQPMLGLTYLKSPVSHNGLSCHGNHIKIPIHNDASLRNAFQEYDPLTKVILYPILQPTTLKLVAKSATFFLGDCVPLPDPPSRVRLLSTDAVIGWDLESLMPGRYRVLVEYYRSIVHGSVSISAGLVERYPASCRTPHEAAEQYRRLVPSPHCLLATGSDPYDTTHHRQVCLGEYERMGGMDRNDHFVIVADKGKQPLMSIRRLEFVYLGT